MKLNEMISAYNRLAYTHNYIFGYADNGKIKFVITDSKILPKICILDKASRGQGNSLRYKPNKAQKALLNMLNPIEICEQAEFEIAYENSTYNRGEIFEKMVTEKFGQAWAKDNKKFTEAGDIEVNGIAYQVKFDKATFTNEKTLASLTC